MRAGKESCWAGSVSSKCLSRSRSSLETCWTLGPVDAFVSFVSQQPCPQLALWLEAGGLLAAAGVPQVADGPRSPRCHSQVPVGSEGAEDWTDPPGCRCLVAAILVPAVPPEAAASQPSLSSGALLEQG